MEIYNNTSIIQFDIGLSEWLGNQRFQMTIPLKNVCIHILSMCDCLERFGNADSLLGNIEDTGNDSYLVTFTKKELTLLYNSYPEISGEVVKTKVRNNKRSKAQYDKLFETLNSISNLKVKRVYSSTHKEIMIMGRTITEENGKYSIEINKSFTREVLMCDKKGLHGNLYKWIAGGLTPLELTIFTFILYNHTAIETQMMNGSPYLGYSYDSLVSMWGISPRPEDGNISIRRALEGINELLHTKLNFEYDGSRIRFFCEQGGVQMGKKYFKDDSKPLPRVTTALVSLFKVKYENYYGKKCNIKDDKLHYEIRQSFEVFGLDIYDVGDRDWYEHNVLQDLFKKYDDLGYSEGKAFGAGHLHVEWLMINLVNNIPNKKKEDKNDLTGKVGTVPMEHQDWMDIDVSNVDDEEVF